MKIKTKILWPLLGMSLLVALIGALAVNRQQVAAMMAATKEAEDVAHALGLALISDSNQLDDSARAVVRRLHKTEGRDVVLVDTHKLVLADAIPASIGETFTEDQHDEVAATLKDGKVRKFTEISKDHPAGIKQIVAPVQSESGQMLGAVILEYTPLYNTLMQSTRSTVRELIGTVFASVVIALSIAVYMGRSIARPLEKLTKAAIGFASGRTDLPMPRPRKDEIGQLAKAFNDMVQKRQRAEADLQSMHDELEVRVVERTADLAKANERLQLENSERKQAEEARRISEARYRSLFEYAPDGIVIANSEICYTDANASICRMLGYTRDELIGLHASDIVAQKEIQNIGPAVDRIKARSDYHQEWQFRRKDGSNFVAEVIATLLPDGNMLAMIRDITERKQAEAELEKAHVELVETSRQAGMAEVATGVLHNVGNVLNSVNVASSCIADSVRKSKASNLSRIVALLSEHETDLGAFLTDDPKGKQIPGFLGQLAERLTTEQTDTLNELAGLQKNIEHIKEIVTRQQSFAKMSGATEKLSVAHLVEDALNLNSSSLARHEIVVTRDFQEVPPIVVDKHKVLQILVNLMSNAKQACDASAPPEKRLTLRVTGGNGYVRIAVTDNGNGIPAENLARIFTHGFTTKKTGHGFGLHSAALAAKEMGGSLAVRSDGPGRGATFTLELPCPIDDVGTRTTEGTNPK
jgi:PAS domain S-box-containing protein